MGAKAFLYTIAGNIPDAVCLYLAASGRTGRYQVILYP